MKENRPFLYMFARHVKKTALFYLLVISHWSLVISAPAQLVHLPSPPQLSPAGYQLLLDYEVGGGEPYFDRFLARPTWPGVASGATIGIGYDLGYNSAAVIRQDWQRLAQRDRLAAVAGINGWKAKAVVSQIRDILISWHLARDVFDRTTVTRFYQLTQRTFPGLAALSPNAQAALVSLVFNRGSSMAGPRRAEMRAIRATVPDRNYPEIARQLRLMKRIWIGQGADGLLRRREAEARLVETP